MWWKQRIEKVEADVTTQGEKISSLEEKLNEVGDLREEVKPLKSTVESMVASSAADTAFKQKIAQLREQLDNTRHMCLKQ